MSTLICDELVKSITVPIQNLLLKLNFDTKQEYLFVPMHVFTGHIQISESCRVTLQLVASESWAAVAFHRTARHVPTLNALSQTLDNSPQWCYSEQRPTCQGICLEILLGMSAFSVRLKLCTGQQMFSCQLNKTVPLLDEWWNCI